MSDATVRRGGFLSAIAGALFVPYAFFKGRLSSVITAEGWHLFGLSPETSAQLFHAFEAVPLGLMMVGLVALHVRIGARGRLADAGVPVALVGFGLTVLTHMGEHLLASWTVPALTGGANWFLWGYYLSWLVLYAGLALYGTSLMRMDGVPGWLPWLFVVVFPLVVAVGLAVVALGVFTVAGTFRSVQGLVWAVVGYWLWMGVWDTPVSRSGDLATSREPDDV
jgi:hypothetical protein